MEQVKGSTKENITEFIYMGDPQCDRLYSSGDDYSQWGRLLRQARGRTETSLLLLGGDIVNRKGKESEWQGFLKELKKEASDMQLITPVTGSKASIERHSEHFFNTGNGPAGYEKHFFSFDYGDIHFIVLESEHMAAGSSELENRIKEWLNRDLEAASKPVKIAVMHQPMFTAFDWLRDDINAQIMRNGFLGILQRHSVDFILCGHQHVYSRTKEIISGGSESAGEGNEIGITQIMGVSGTKFFEAVPSDILEVFITKTSVATIFRTDGKKISLETIDMQGNEVD